MGLPAADTGAHLTALAAGQDALTEVLRRLEAKLDELRRNPASAAAAHAVAVAADAVALAAQAGVGVYPGLLARAYRMRPSPPSPAAPLRVVPG